MVHAAPASTATVYIGRHFEVREHEQPVKYVFNSSTRLARVTGSLSANGRLQRMRLWEGWNLCSLAVTATNALEQLSGVGSSLVDRAGRWDRPSREWVPVSASETLAGGTVLWVHARTNGISCVVGAYAEPAAQTVQAEGDFLSGIGLETWEFQAALSNAPVAAAYDYDAAGARWRVWLAPPLNARSDLSDVLPPGSAAFVRSAGPVQLETPSLALRIQYYHQDHLGSSAVVADGEGAILEETTYYGFGHTRTTYRRGGGSGPFQFTQKERDAESGLDHFEARYFAGGLGRFVSPDMKYLHPDLLTGEDRARILQNPQQIGLYAYVRNNPMGYVDPTGFDSRPLKAEERAILHEVYGDSIPYDRILVSDSLGIGGREWTSVTPGPLRIYSLNVGENGFKNGLETVSEGVDPTTGGLLVHEAGHVWQSEHTGLTRYGYFISSGWRQVAAELLAGIDWKELAQGRLETKYWYDPYAYDKSDVGRRPWSHFNPEQQANIIEHYYLNTKGQSEAEKAKDPAYKYIQENVQKGKEWSKNDMRLYYKQTFGVDMK